MQRLQGLPQSLIGYMLQAYFPFGFYRIKNMHIQTIALVALCISTLCLSSSSKEEKEELIESQASKKKVFKPLYIGEVLERRDKSHLITPEYNENPGLPNN